MSVLGEIIARGWDNFTARRTGVFSLRFLIQPALASILAIRAGIQDAHASRPAYLWAVLTRSDHRAALLKAALKDLRTPLLIAAALDAIYQTLANKAIYLFEMLFTVIMLALVPYVLVRGPVNRLVRALRRAGRPGHSTGSRNT